MKKRTFCIGDIHGAAKALKQCIERSGANIKKDKFIVLGDVTDGWPEVAEAIELLMEIEDLIYITGNHDIWAREYLRNPNPPKKMSAIDYYSTWIVQGGQASIDSYKDKPELLIKHLDFLDNAVAYHEDNNRLFIHGGYKPHQLIEDQIEFDLAWDRWFWSVIRTGRNLGITYDEVYIGHSPTINYPKNDGSHKQPMNYGKVWNLDTGATYTGMLSIMDIDTKEFWQSDVVKDLYPDHKGRN